MMTSGPAVDRPCAICGQRGLSDDLWTETALTEAEGWSPTDPKARDRIREEVAAVLDRWRAG